MLQVPAGASGSEQNATSPASAVTSSSAPARAPKLRSCVVCRSRKVRCDKQSPCSNCRRAKIACVFASTERPPKWARRLERLTNKAAASTAGAPQDADPGVGKVMDRVRNLENLVKELRHQLEQAHTASSSGGGGSSEPNWTSTEDRELEYQRGLLPATDTSSVQKQFGRLVLQDASNTRYVSSGFWSRVNDELDGLKTDTSYLAGDDSDSSGDAASSEMSPPTQELERTPSERHAFLFRHNLSPLTHDLREFHPLPSQIPFLLDVFSENVNTFTHIVHLPTVTMMVRGLRGSDMTPLTPANEALMFSIYYAAITSMEEDDVMTNFGSSKTDLNLKYRLGLEHALAKADFLNAPDIVLVQALSNFLCLVRRHDSPRFVWMMTGLVIRMAQYLGLQRDGANFEHLTPFEIEMRRRVWWAVCILDLRASEDQGTDLTITSGSFDTKIPLNINDADINPDSTEMPTEREGLTEMTFARLHVSLYDIMRRLMAPGLRDGAAGLEDKSRLLNEIYQEYERGYFQYAADLDNIAYWVGVTVARLVMAKMTLIVFLPVLFASPSDHFSDEIRTRLLISAIEVAEYNHALNAEQACRKWRWIFQTYTHWHSIVYLLIETSRRPWSPTIERAWVALHSSWLIPTQTTMNKNLRMWFPLRRLMAKARRHREAEVTRLRANPQAAARLDIDDQNLPLPSSSGFLLTGSSVDVFRERWRTLVDMTEGFGDGTTPPAAAGAGFVDPSMNTAYTSQPNARSHSTSSPGDPNFNISSDLVVDITFGQAEIGTSGQQPGESLRRTTSKYLEQTITTNTPDEAAIKRSVGTPHNPLPPAQAEQPTSRAMGPGSFGWLWADADPSTDVFSNLDIDSFDLKMDLDGEVNWYDWIESAKGLEYAARPSGNEWS